MRNVLASSTLYKLEDLLRFLKREGFKVRLDVTDHQMWRLRWALKTSAWCVIVDDISEIAPLLVKWMPDWDATIPGIVYNGPASRKNLDDYVSVDKLAKAVEASRLSYSDICRRVGPPFTREVNGKDWADVSTFKRAVGISPSTGSGQYKGRSYFSKRIHRDKAVAIIRALGRDPYEFGL